MGGEGDTGPVKLSRPAAAGGIAGPVLFTVAWVVSSLRQAGHSAVEVQLSGLAAEDARDPQIMMAGFVLLGAGTVVFGAGFGRVTAPRSARPVAGPGGRRGEHCRGVVPARSHAAGRPGFRR